MNLFQIIILVLTVLSMGCTQNQKVDSISEQTVTPTIKPEDSEGFNQELNPKIQKLKEQLNLSEQQTLKLNQVFNESEIQQKELTNQRKIIHKKFIDLQEKKLNRINAVLTTDQAKKYEKIRNSPPEEVMKAFESKESESSHIPNK